jgi:hypothetical protein
MDKKSLIKLLQIQFEHNRKIREFRGKLNLDYFEIDLLGVVLDALGIPADNSVEQIEKYGYAGWLAQPETVSRFGYYQEFEAQVVNGTDEECQAYLDTIALADQPSYLLDLKAVLLADA